MSEMNEVEIEALAMRLATHQATTEDEVAWSEILAARPEQAAQMLKMQQEMSETYATVAVASALSLSTRAGRPLPDYRKAQLRSSLRRTIPQRRRFFLPFGGFRWASGSALLLGGLALVWVIPTQPKVIELGMYRTELVRGRSNGYLFTSKDSLKRYEFDSDAEFDEWLRRPFTGNEKARLWLDDAAGLIHVRIAPHWWTEGREWTHPLSMDEAERERQIQEVISTINSD